MDTARQLVRWSIPGAVFLLFVSVSTAVIGRWFAQGPLIGTIDASVVILAAVPVGFLIYQFYFFGYDRGRKYFIPVDRGQQVLVRVARELRTEMNFVDSLANLTGWNESYLRSDENVELWRRFGPKPVYRLKSDGDPADYRRARAANLAVLSVLTDHIGACTNSSNLRREYTNLADIYHSQGACRSALTTALVVTLSNFMPAWRSTGFLSVLSVAMGLSAAAILIYLVLDFARRNTLERLELTWTYGIVAGCRDSRFTWPHP